MKIKLSFFDELSKKWKDISSPLILDTYHVKNTESGGFRFDYELWYFPPKDLKAVKLGYFYGYDDKNMSEFIIDFLNTFFGENKVIPGETIMEMEEYFNGKSDN